MSHIFIRLDIGTNGDDQFMHEKSYRKYFDIELLIIPHDLLSTFVSSSTTQVQGPSSQLVHFMIRNESCSQMLAYISIISIFEASPTFSLEGLHNY